MKKIAQVHMLPTNKVSYIVKHTNGRLYPYKASKRHLYEDCTYQYLYITTYDEIKEGDNILEVATQRVGKYHCDTVYKTHNLITEVAYPYGTLEFFRKIVASDNPELLNKGTIEDFYADDKKFALNISDKFAYDYTLSYNKGNVIKEVMLEYGETKTAGSRRLMESPEGYKYYNVGIIIKTELIHDSNGSVIITPVPESVKIEKMYTRDEMMKAAADYALDCLKLDQQGKVIQNYKDWFDKHYPEK